MRQLSRDEDVIRIGVIAPLTSPGWIGAGRHLLAGIELGFEEVAEEGAIGRNVELLVQDTAADASKAVASVEMFTQAGVAAIVGEYHSVVARAVAMKTDEVSIPYLCTSAVLDALVDHPTDWVGRLSPPQSRGWSEFVSFLIAEGHRRIAVARARSIYWEAGVSILRKEMEKDGGQVLEIDVTDMAPSDAIKALIDADASALLLLVGSPDPFTSIVAAVRNDSRFSGMLVGAPAGQPELAEVHAVLGGQGGGIPFLQYLPHQLPERGLRVSKILQGRLGEQPSFVALEGYDAALVIGELVRLRVEGSKMGEVWPRIRVEGSRGEIRFSRVSGSNVWQWAEAPVRIADRDPETPSMIRDRGCRPSILER